MTTDYQALLLVGFGGPEKREDVLPFLENVLRGKRVPRERMLEVAEHYYHFDGVSPINEHCRQLLAALKPALQNSGIDLPVYWGNRNWHPLLTDTMEQMKADGIERVLSIVLSSCSSYSGCRQYRENIQDAQELVGENAPQVDKLRVFYNHPQFINASCDRVASAIEQLTSKGTDREEIRLVFTAHSIPFSMSSTSDYEKQLQETCRLVCEQLDWPHDRQDLVYQSRSGRPQDPWLEPDVLEHLEELHRQGVNNVVIYPVGFLSDHMEVMFDLDIEAKELCEKLGMQMERAETVGTHPEMIRCWVDLIEERISDREEKRAIGQFPANHDVCPLNCCPKPVIVREPAKPA
ncbi:Ferrochelatase [Polystyrenella longa]|uniref:Ferrochelatase n=1 Tax=Polystyrenella longa TaxID=2528007 RepID=A0A518CQJ5_9PLAN|nr:ferrochelatase [Polystyrenella longa]QDU81474.1 Ferrochelatase [Polystyrenella longa]